MGQTPPAKVVFIGDTNVGKTSMIRKYATLELQGMKPTVSGEAMNVVIGERKIALTVWDTPGHTDTQP
jgi:small GTP-binding protein